MASGSITTWQIEGGKVEVVTDFLFLGSKTTVGGDCSHEIRRHLLLGRKAMINLDSVEKQRHYSADKGLYNQGYMYSYESWTVKKVECLRIEMPLMCSTGEES